MRLAIDLVRHSVVVAALLLAISTCALAQSADKYKLDLEAVPLTSDDYRSAPIGLRKKWQLDTGTFETTPQNYTTPTLPGDASGTVQSGVRLHLSF